LRKRGRSSLPDVGDIVGGTFQLTRRLGSGGTGEVFEALDRELGERVAVKLLNTERCRDDRGVERFRREATTAAAIGHDAVVAVTHMGGFRRGAPYIVMELLEGEPLQAKLSREAWLDIPFAAYVASRALDGLAAAHAVGVVHRDLKPSNVFLVSDGGELPGVKLLDFGTSRMVNGRGSCLDARITRVGDVLGSPDYMSPEQARGQLDVDHRSDIFAVGLILYRALTGQLPFPGRDYEAVLARILVAKPPPTPVLRPEVPMALDRVIRRALTKDRDGRYQTARQMLVDLTPFVDQRAA